MKQSLIYFLVSNSMPVTTLQQLVTDAVAKLNAVCLILQHGKTLWPRTLRVMACFVDNVFIVELLICQFLNTVVHYCG